MTWPLLFLQTKKVEYKQVPQLQFSLVHINVLTWGNSATRHSSDVSLSCATAPHLCTNSNCHNLCQSQFIIFCGTCGPHNPPQGCSCASGAKSPDYSQISPEFGHACSKVYHVVHLVALHQVYYVLTHCLSYLQLTLLFEPNNYGYQ